MKKIEKEITQELMVVIRFIARKYNKSYDEVYKLLIKTIQEA